MAKADDPQGLISTPLHGIYIPVALIVAGTTIIKLEWVWYSVALSVALAAFKIFRGRE